MPGLMSWIGEKVRVTLHSLGATRFVPSSQVTLSYQSNAIDSMKPARPLPPVSLNDFATALGEVPVGDRNVVSSWAKLVAELAGVIWARNFAFWVLVGVNALLGIR